MTYTTQESSNLGGSPVELYKFSIGDQVYCYTNNDSSIIYGSQVFQPSEIKRGDISNSKSNGNSSIILQVARDHEIAVMFRLYVPGSDMRVSVYRQHRTDIDSETYHYWTGILRSVTWKEDIAEISCDPLTTMLQRMGLRYTYQKNCNHVLYGTNCGVAKLTHKITGTIVSINGDQYTISGIASSPGYLTAGIITINNESRFIVSHDGSSTITLLLPFESASIGQSVDVYPGCDKLFTTCKNKFSNEVNFGGFPFIPTKNPFQVGVK